MVAVSMRKDVEAWCLQAFGHGQLTPVLPEAGGQMSDLFRFDSNRGEAVAVKVRPESLERIDRCLQLQAFAADAGFPCARPLTAAHRLRADMVVHAESWRSSGQMYAGSDHDFAARSASLLARLVAILEGEAPTGLGAPPPWISWNPPTGSLWPPNPAIDAMDQNLVPERVNAIARSVSERLTQTTLPLVVGHGDWESQNLRWQGTSPTTVHDWDSLVALPEAAIVGAASGAFTSTTIPTLAPMEASEAFIDRYEEATGRRFTHEEREIAWAASLWPALHNARGESLFKSPPTALSELTNQAPARLRLAGIR
ncbi:phosphotransferase [Arthrobacter sp. BPSS-3]|uniref:phosphotransferase n=1 Tax=Arthrobacter sp. BPSS-3 TaxID=3366580 RepID=UPI0037DC7BB2